MTISTFIKKEFEEDNTVGVDFSSLVKRLLEIQDAAIDKQDIEMALRSVLEGHATEKELVDWCKKYAN